MDCSVTQRFAQDEQLQPFLHRTVCISARDILDVPIISTSAVCV